MIVSNKFQVVTKNYTGCGRNGMKYKETNRLVTAAPST